MHSEFMIEGAEVGRAASAAIEPSRFSGGADADDVAIIGVVDAKTALASFAAGLPIVPRFVLVDCFDELPEQV